LGRDRCRRTRARMSHRALGLEEHSDQERLAQCRRELTEAAGGGGNRTRAGFQPAALWVTSEDTPTCPSVRECRLKAAPGRSDSHRTAYAAVGERQRTTVTRELLDLGYKLEIVTRDAHRAAGPRASSGTEAVPTKARPSRAIPDQKNSPSRVRFRPPPRRTFRFRVRPTGEASAYSRPVLGASGNLNGRVTPRKGPATVSLQRATKSFQALAGASSTFPSHRFSSATVTWIGSPRR
jgi:hypothetical protein